MKQGRTIAVRVDITAGSIRAQHRYDNLPDPDSRGPYTMVPGNLGHCQVLFPGHDVGGINMGFGNNKLHQSISQHSVPCSPLGPWPSPIIHSLLHACLSRQIEPEMLILQQP